jgi:uncharacterized protein YegP (UPF0339 family)
MSKFTLYTDKNHDFRWKFVANNEAIVARSSEGYRSKEDCIKSLEVLRSDIGASTVDPEVQVAPTKGVAGRAPTPSPAPAVLPAAEVKAVVAPSAS